MTLSIQDQIKQQIEKAESILILTKPDATCDAVAASWGLFHLFKSLGKNPAVLANDACDGKMKFLAAPEKREPQITGARDFVLSFDTKRNKIIDFRTEQKNGAFEIYVTPEKGMIDPRDFSFIPAKFKFDLLLVLGCSTLDQLGELKEKNSDLFFEVPLVNMDNSPANENYGQLNLVDITAPSISEVAADLAKSLGEKSIGPNCAGCFLAGIISATGNFQDTRTNPRTFLAASWLIENGANQQEIIRHLWKTQSFPFLKLWGRVMARLNWNENLKIAWSLVSVEDFVQSRTTQEELPLILEKIKDNFGKGRFFAVLYAENQSKTVALVKANDPKKIHDLTLKTGGRAQNGHMEIAFEGKNLVEAEKELLKLMEAA